MTGSLDNFVYISDDSEEYVIRCDKSNIVAITTSPPFPTVILPSIPRGLIPRYVLYRSIDGKQTRKIPVLKPMDAMPPGGLPLEITGVGVNAAGTTILNLVFRRAFYHGERSSYPVISDDTGISEPP